MVRTIECDYCGSDIEPGTGTMLVRNDGSTTHFCSSKCENNADLGREARNLGWTESGRGAKPAAEETADEEADTASAEETADVDADEAAAESDEEAADADDESADTAAADDESADAEQADADDDTDEDTEEADDEAEEAQA